MRLAKQILYSIFFLIIIIGIITMVYLWIFKPVPTCFDGKQNQNEVGVDCGGDCISCDLKNLEKLEIKDISLFRASDGVGVVVSLYNPNISWGAKELTYDIEVKNNLGEVIKTINSKSFIYSGELKYIVEPYIKVDRSEVSNANFYISNEIWESSEIFIQPNIEVSDINTTKKDGDFLKVTGTLGNKDEVDYSNVNIIALLYSKNGDLVSTSKTKLDGLKSFESYKFIINFPKDLTLKKQTLDFSSYFPKDLKLGDSGEDVSNLQIFLAEIGILDRGPTGYYDDVTKSAVEAIQKQFNLSINGELDNQTRQYLIDIINKNANTGSSEENVGIEVDSSETKIFIEAIR